MEKDERKQIIAIAKRSRPGGTRLNETNRKMDILWDDNPVDVTQEANCIWGIANKLRGSYMPDKYGDVIIPMTIIRRFECALQDTKGAVIKQFEEPPKYPAKAMCNVLDFQFYNTSRYKLKELNHEY